MSTGKCSGLLKLRARNWRKVLGMSRSSLQRLKKICAKVICSAKTARNKFKISRSRLIARQTLALLRRNKLSSLPNNVKTTQQRCSRIQTNGSWSWKLSKTRLTWGKLKSTVLRSFWRTGTQSAFCLKLRLLTLTFGLLRLMKSSKPNRERTTDCANKPAIWKSLWKTCICLAKAKALFR